MELTGHAEAEGKSRSDRESALGLHEAIASTPGSGSLNKRRWLSALATGDKVRPPVMKNADSGACWTRVDHLLPRSSYALKGTPPDGALLAHSSLKSSYSPRREAMGGKYGKTAIRAMRGEHADHLPTTCPWQRSPC